MNGKTLLIALTLSFCVGAGPAAAADQPDAQKMDHFVTLMSKYLSLADQVVSVANRQDAAIFLAIEGIFEVYEQRKDAPGAVRHLNRILETHAQDRTVRNLVRFKLRDIYKETGQMDKALEQLDLIISENS